VISGQQFAGNSVRPLQATPRCDQATPESTSRSSRPAEGLRQRAPRHFRQPDPDRSPPDRAAATSGSRQCQFSLTWLLDKHVDSRVLVIGEPQGEVGRQRYEEHPAFPLFSGQRRCEGRRDVPSRIVAENDDADTRGAQARGSVRPPLQVGRTFIRVHGAATPHRSSRQALSGLAAAPASQNLDDVRDVLGLGAKQRDEAQHKPRDGCNRRNNNSRHDRPPLGHVGLSPVRETPIPPGSGARWYLQYAVRTTHVAKQTPATSSRSVTRATVTVNQNPGTNPERTAPVVPGGAAHPQVGGGLISRLGHSTLWSPSPPCAVRRWHETECGHSALVHRQGAVVSGDQGCLGGRRRGGGGVFRHGAGGSCADGVADRASSGLHDLVRASSGIAVIARS